MTIEEARKLWIVNGIGGDEKKGGFNFSLFFKNNIQQFKEYIPEKWIKLFYEIDYLSIWHDLAYYNWNALTDKIKADYNFSLWVFKKLNWTTFLKRLFVFIVIFTILLIAWNKYFNWGEKRYITLK
jgi:hypothetical protein